jgi:hypothetical protein
MVQGSCHCGAVQWRCQAIPDSAEACNCTICRRYGVLWAYGFEGEGISVSGATQSYIPRRTEFHFCFACGCVAYWREREPGPKGRRRIAVNLRLAEPEAVAQIPIDRVVGLDDTFKHLPRDGRCITDYWF